MIATNIHNLKEVVATTIFKPLIFTMSIAIALQSSGINHSSLIEMEQSC
jgi:hypothetical protein